MTPVANLPPVSRYQWQFATGDVDTGSKFATGFVDISGKFAIGVNNTRGTGGKICRRCHWYRWQICRRCRWHRWCTLTCEYLREFSKKFEMILMLLSGAWGKVIHEKTWSKKSRHTVPLNMQVNFTSGPFDQSLPLGPPPLNPTFSSEYYNTVGWLLLVWWKLPLTHWPNSEGETGFGTIESVDRIAEPAMAKLSIIAHCVLKNSTIVRVNDCLEVLQHESMK